MKKLTALFMLAAFILPLHSWSCSSFGTGAGGNALMAKSYDWSMAEGLLFTNKRNVEKRAMSLNPQQPSNFKWTSKYGSVTFNQYGRELPNGGINERGLAIEVLWLAESQYQSPDARPGLNEGQWVQYHLDNYASVEEMVAEADSVRLSPIFAKIHHLACDSTGACAVFENIGGKLVISRGANVSAITNSTYDASADYLRGFEGFGGDKSIPMSGYDSKDRFVRVQHMQKEFARLAGSEERAEHAFSILKAVRKNDYSRWNIVYDFARGLVSFKFLPNGEGIRQFSLEGIDFSCRAPVKYFKLSSAEDFSWKDYDFAENLALIRLALKDHHSQLPNPELIADRLSRYPDATKCLE